MYAFQCNSTHTLNHFFCVELNLWSVHCIHFVCVHWMEYFNTGKLLCNSRYSHGFHGGFVHTRRLYMCGTMQLYCQYAVSTACMVSHSLVQLVSPVSTGLHVCGGYCMGSQEVTTCRLEWCCWSLQPQLLWDCRIENRDTVWLYTIIGMM